MNFIDLELADSQPINIGPERRQGSAKQSRISSTRLRILLFASACLLA